MLDNFGRTETNLKRSGKHAPRSKFVSGTTFPDTILTVQDRELSGNPSSPTFNIASKLAISIILIVLIIVILIKIRGFFLFEAEQRKKVEKQNNKKKLKNLRDFIESSDDDFM